MVPITPLGRKWEYRHSIWLVWLITPFGYTTFISFFYIGIRTQKKKWLYSAFVYFIIIVFYTHVANEYPTDHILFNIFVGIVLVAWIVGCIHAFLARREYLQIIASRKEPEKMKLFLEKLENNRSSSKMKTNQAMASKSTAKKINHRNRTPALKMMDKKNEKSSTKREPVRSVTIKNKININKVTERELITLVGLNQQDAQTIIKARKESGPFSSLNHFIQLTNIKPHIVVKMQPYIVFEEKQLESTSARIGEEQNTNTGRIVDY